MRAATSGKPLTRPASERPVRLLRRPSLRPAWHLLRRLPVCLPRCFVARIIDRRAAALLLKIIGKRTVRRSSFGQDEAAAFRDAKLVVDRAMADDHDSGLPEELFGSGPLTRARLAEFIGVHSRWLNFQILEWRAGLVVHRLLILRLSLNSYLELLASAAAS